MVDEAKSEPGRSAATRGAAPGSVWRTEFETLDQAREEIQGYLDRYHRRPHSGLGYRTPLEVRQTWEDPFRLRKEAA